jgi:phosphomannomutase
VGCPDAVKFNIVSTKIGGEMKILYPDAKYVEIDGVRMDTENEMLIVRASQNGPYLTVKFEGKTQEQYDKLKKQASDILHKYPEVDFKSGVNTSALE